MFKLCLRILCRCSFLLVTWELALPTDTSIEVKWSKLLKHNNKNGNSKKHSFLGSHSLSSSVSTYIKYEGWHWRWQVLQLTQPWEWLPKKALLFEFPFLLLCLSNLDHFTSIWVSVGKANSQVTKRTKQRQSIHDHNLNIPWHSSTKPNAENENGKLGDYFRERFIDIKP